MSQVQIYVLYLSLRTKINNFLRLQNEVGLQNSTFKPKINLIKACKVFLVKLRCLTVVQHQLFVWSKLFQTD